jgi:hypothetical protein
MPFENVNPSINLIYKINELGISKKIINFNVNKVL